ncbi:Zn(II)2Cys6 transcription factor [Aspergillus undulatus]|uniref:Zn(II)2Cys6 transcription factor n=1 Tax=Aspergillus undulatus TaxID=1810928 RepID=UPI003CCDCA5D
MDSNETVPLFMEQCSDSSSSDIPLALKKSPDARNAHLDKVTKPPRKRSRIACTWCRDRKVRCDASSHGIPCTNCELDQQECVVHAASQAPRVKRPKYLKHQPYPSPNTPSNPRPSVFQPSAKASQEFFLSQTWSEGGNQTPWKTPQLQLAPPGTISDVFYTHHTFLKLPSFFDMPQEDIRYLNSKGCFRVPGGGILDEFVRSYFLYMHPCLPIINEAEFWRMYYGQLCPGRGHENGGLSLFVFQAMLFASCPFVSPTAIQSAGFSDTRAARNTLYTRAKLLYDLNCEISPLFIAQGSLLLSYHTSSNDLHAGSLWLSISIQGASLFNALNPDLSPKTDNIKKRIRWCIILTDRLTALGLGRHLALGTETMGTNTAARFGIASGEGVLSEADLEDELDASEVYDSETKRLLAKVLAVQCELVLCLGNVLILSTALLSGIGLCTQMKSENVGHEHVDPTQVKLDTGSSTGADSLHRKQQIADCKSELLRWSTSAKAALGVVVNSHLTHHSVGLYFGLTFFYYHAARLALSNVEAMTLQLGHVPETTDITINSTAAMQEEEGREVDHERIRDELEDACGCITDTIKRFLAQGVAQHLPITTLPLISHPLLLSALDVKLSSTKSQSATRKRRFRYYSNLMQVFQARYDGTDAIAGSIQRTLLLAESIIPRLHVGSGNQAAGRRPQCSSWSELFSERPGCYLQLVGVLGLALKGGNSRGFQGFQNPVGKSTRATCSSDPAFDDTIPSHPGHVHDKGPGPSLEPGTVMDPTSLCDFPETKEENLQPHRQRRHQQDLHSCGTNQKPLLQGISSFETDGLGLVLDSVLPGTCDAMMDTPYAYTMHLDSMIPGHSEYAYGDEVCPNTPAGSWSHIPRTYPIA